MKKSLFILASMVLSCNYVAKAQTITTVVGNGAVGSIGDGGAATACEINFAYGSCFDASGNLYIADALNHRIRKINTSGIITTIAGTGAAGFSGDGAVASLAQLNRPTDIAIDVMGNLYISDELNSCVRKINTTGIISTYAGMGGMSGNSGDGGAATSAMIQRPNTISIDGAGNIYFSDYLSNVVRKVNTSGTITRVAGNASMGYSGDGGQATAASFYYPCKTVVDNAGNLYIADEYNLVVRKVNTAGIISTVAGNHTAGFSGDGGAATAASINYAEYIQVDHLGNLYIADKVNNRIRKVNTAGIISTIVGTGTQGYTGDGGPAISAEIYEPEAITFDVYGNMYFSDIFNYAYRKVTNVTAGIDQTKNTIEGLTIYPNPSAGILTIEVLNATENCTYKAFNILGQEVKSGNLTQTSNQVSLQELNNGVYSIVVSQKDKTSIAKIIVQK